MGPNGEPFRSMLVQSIAYFMKLPLWERSSLLALIIFLAGGVFIWLVAGVYLGGRKAKAAGGIFFLLLFSGIAVLSAGYSYHENQQEQQRLVQADLRKKQLAADLKKLAQQAEKNAASAQDSGQNEDLESAIDPQKQAKKQYQNQLRAIENDFQGKAQEDQKKIDALQALYKKNQIDNFAGLIQKATLEIQRQDHIVAMLDQKIALIESISFVDEKEKNAALTRLKQKKAIAELSRTDYEGILRDVQEHQQAYRDMD